MDTRPPFPRLSALKLKQAFLLTNLASSLASEQQAARSHFLLHFCFPNLDPCSLRERVSEATMLIQNQLGWQP